MASTTTTLRAGRLAALALALASPAAAEDYGEKVFRKCQVCHTVEPGMNRVGPSLFGVVGRVPGTVDGFRYSEAMKRFGADSRWTGAVLDAYLTDPRGVVKGTRMAFPGLKDPADRAAVIEFLGRQVP